ncbi:hypothetical protein H8S95_14810 [Pontibacter sp. KCTC 32443]|uniref:hypothetical protein n=1 Tax=Pontibacter TaxID=323449 RepID=UPI00164E4936|nr:MULTISPECIES: hypothetical protein [Pontibacter]MBC5775348.1 hypothetical protein [Pontibacter sp. KCTC 32443]
MIKKIALLSIGLGATLLMSSCSKDSEEVSPSGLSSSSTDAAKAAVTEIINPLTISDLSTTDGKTWMFTVQKTGDGNISNIGSLMLALTDCNDAAIPLTAANVTYASVAGTSMQVLTPSFKEGNGSACDMSGVTGYLRLSDFAEKITNGSVYTFRVTLSEAVSVKTANIRARISNNCYPVTVDGPGCELDLCGEGQGFFHKSEHWPVSEIMIGGHTYTAAEAVTLITSDKKEGGVDNKGGIADSKAAFAQGVTVLLNRELGWISEEAYAAELATIETYLSSLNKLTTYAIDNLPTGNAAAKAAAGAIGDSIVCEETE